MKKSYPNPLALAKHLVEKHGLPDGVTFVGLNEHNQFQLDIDLKQSSGSVSFLSEIAGQCNFVERLMYSNMHLIEAKQANVA